MAYPMKQTVTFPCFSFFLVAPPLLAQSYINTYFLLGPLKTLRQVAIPVGIRNLNDEYTKIEVKDQLLSFIFYHL
jgi:hypothetical protein